jgi:hypothetical protein
MTDTMHKAIPMMLLAGVSSSAAAAALSADHSSAHTTKNRNCEYLDLNHSAAEAPRRS